LDITLGTTENATFLLRKASEGFIFRQGGVGKLWGDVAEGSQTIKQDFTG